MLYPPHMTSVRPSSRRHHKVDCPDRVVLAVIDDDGPAMTGVLQTAARIASHSGAEFGVLRLHRIIVCETAVIQLGTYPLHALGAIELQPAFVNEQPQHEAPIRWLHNAIDQRCCGTVVILNRATALPRRLRWVAPFLGDLSRHLKQRLSAPSTSWTIVDVREPDQRLTDVDEVIEADPTPR